MSVRTKRMAEVIPLLRRANLWERNRPTRQARLKVGSLLRPLTAEDESRVPEATTPR